MSKAVELIECWCCNLPHQLRDPLNDPWQGRLDGYCEECAINRCDAYLEDCPNRNLRQRGRKNYATTPCVVAG